MNMKYKCEAIIKAILATIKYKLEILRLRIGNISQMIVKSNIFDKQNEQ